MSFIKLLTPHINNH